ncbi:MAG: hypothetical protein B7Z55_11430, partial [Planctomycetales bacterium 12-60-4]
TQPVARVWEALLPADESYRRLTRTSDAQLMADDTGLAWSPVYTTVAGNLPMPGLPTFGTNVKIVQSERLVAFVRTDLQVTTAGKVTLRWNDPAALQLWIDRKPVDPAAEMTLDLSPGLHPIAVAIDLRQRKTPLRLELGTASESAKFAVRP